METKQPILIFFTKEHIRAFKKILIESVDKHWDKSIYNDMIEEYEEAEPEEPEELDENKLRETRKNMCRKITEAFAPGWYDDLIEEGNSAVEQDNDDE